MNYFAKIIKSWKQTLKQKYTSTLIFGGIFLFFITVCTNVANIQY